MLVDRSFMRRKHPVLAALATSLVAMFLLLPVVYTLSKEPPRFRASATILLAARPTLVPRPRPQGEPRPELILPWPPPPKRRGLSEEVLDRLPKTAMDDLTRSPYHVDYASMLRNAYLRLRGFEPEVESPRQRALTELQNARVKFESRGDGILDISAEAFRPQVAVDIVNTYIEVMLSRQMKVVRIIDPPGPPTPTASDNRLRFLAAALVMSLSVGVAVYREPR